MLIHVHQAEYDENLERCLGGPLKKVEVDSTQY